MLQRVLGEEMMRHGLMLYLERHQYGNANTDDLWQALSLGSLNSSHPVDAKVKRKLLIGRIGSILTACRILGHHGHLDASIGLPIGDTPSPWQPDSRLAEAFSIGQFFIAQRQFIAQMVRAPQFYDQRRADPREPNLDARKRR